MQELQNMAGSEEERIAILNQSIMNGWSGIFPLREKKSNHGEKSGKNQFHNFTQRDTDYDVLVQQEVCEWLNGGDNEKHAQKDS